MSTILLLIYMATGYWAVGQTFLGKPLFGDYRYLQSQKLFCAIFLGWIVIPIVIVQKIVKSRE